MGKPGGKSKGSKGGSKGGKSGGKRRSGKPKMKKGKKALLDKRDKYLEKKVKKQAQIAHEKTVNKKDKKHWHAEEKGDTISIAWRGKERNIDKSDLQGDKKKRALLKKVRDNRVLNQDEKHTLKMLGDGGTLLQLWEKLRVKPKNKEGKAAKQIQVEKALEMVKKDFIQEARKPDVSRVLQSCVKWGSDASKQEIVRRLKGNVAEMAEGKYSHQLIRSLLIHCKPAEKNALYEELKVKTAHLLSHKFALPVLDHLHSIVSAEKQNALLLQLFSGLQLQGLEGYPHLEQILEKASPKGLDYKQLVERLHKHSGHLLNKGTIDAHFAHRVVELLLKFGTEIEISEAVDELSKGVVHICKTRHGARAATLVVTHSSHAKRKQILKSFEHSVVDMCLGKQTARFVARLFDLVDDTDLVQKHLLTEMCGDITALLTDSVGGLPILHLLTPALNRKKAYFLQQAETLWHEDTPDPFHMQVLDAQYAPRRKRICERHPREKHKAALRILAPAIVQTLEQDPGLMENPLVRRVVQELCNYCDATPASEIGLSSAKMDAFRSTVLKRRRRDDEGAAPAAAAPAQKRKAVAAKGKSKPQPVEAQKSAEPLAEAPAAPAAAGKRRKIVSSGTTTTTTPRREALLKKLIAAKKSKKA
eukprot:Hpha_TRINITY_DN15220_c0_g8::TRINITY_DN15220_c0_g8_i1::g.64515::m.64515/K14844/PUF6; pumilio homology domain family member 6